VRRGSAIALGLLVALTTACSGASSDGSPRDRNDVFTGSNLPGCASPNETSILIAQTVETAVELPCVAARPPGWTFSSGDYRSGSTTYTLSHLPGGYQALKVQLLPDCVPDGEETDAEAPSGVTAYVANPGPSEQRWFVFAGGCIVETFSLPADTSASVLDGARSTLGFASRADLASVLQERYDVTLCGAGAEPCVG
jgi:hypothetical protein